MRKGLFLNKFKHFTVFPFLSGVKREKRNCCSKTEKQVMNKYLVDIFRNVVVCISISIINII